MCSGTFAFLPLRPQPMTTILVYSASPASRATALRHVLIQRGPCTKSRRKGDRFLNASVVASCATRRGCTRNALARKGPRQGHVKSPIRSLERNRSVIFPSSRLYPMASRTPSRRQIRPRLSRLTHARELPPCLTLANATTCATVGAELTANLPPNHKDFPPMALMALLVILPQMALKHLHTQPLPFSSRPPKHRRLLQLTRHRLTHLPGPMSTRRLDHRAALLKRPHPLPLRRPLPLCSIFLPYSFRRFPVPPPWYHPSALSTRSRAPAARAD